MKMYKIVKSEKSFCKTSLCLKSEWLINLFLVVLWAHGPVGVNETSAFYAFSLLIILHTVDPNIHLMWIYSFSSEKGVWHVEESCEVAIFILRIAQSSEKSHESSLTLSLWERTLAFSFRVKVGNHSISLSLSPVFLIHFYLWDLRENLQRTDYESEHFFFVWKKYDKMDLALWLECWISPIWFDLILKKTITEIRRERWCCVLS